jgi:alpha-glucan,water dikinase
MTNNKNELFAEIVCGMGETLVGAFEGQSFSFVYYKDKNNYEIKSYPNKSISLQNSGFIFRSDSNTEDLEGFSGAGLFDSVPMINDNEVEISYANNKFFNDKKFVDDFINKVSSLGIGVEKLYNGVEQDIEGCYYNGDFFIVQTRPQV